MKNLSNLIKLKPYRLDLFFLLTFSIIYFYFQFDFLSLLPTHDEGQGYLGPLFQLDKHGLSYFVQKGAFFNHPPLLQVLLLPLFKIFRPDHIFALRCFFLFLGFFFYVTLYLLSASLQSYNWFDRTVSFLFIICIFFSVIFFQEITMVLGDTYALILWIPFVYGVLKKKNALVLISGIIMGLSRQTLLAFSLASVVYYFLDGKKRSQLSFISITSPIWTYIVVFTFQAIVNGTFFQHDAYTQGSLSLNNFLNYDVFKNLLEMIFIDTAESTKRIFAAIVGIVSLVKILIDFFYYKKDVKKHLLFLLPLLIYIGFFSIYSSPIIRYFNNFFVVLYLLPIITFSNKYFKGMYILVLVVLTLSVFFNNKQYYLNPKGGEAFLRQKLLKKAAVYIEKNYSNKRIFCSNYPADTYLTTPLYKYTTKNWNINTISDIELMKKNGTDVVLHINLYQDEFEEKYLDKIKKEMPLRLTHKECVPFGYELKGLCYFVYEVDSSN